MVTVRNIFLYMDRYAHRTALYTNTEYRDDIIFILIFIFDDYYLAFSCVLLTLPLSLPPFLSITLSPSLSPSLPPSIPPYHPPFHHSFLMHSISLLTTHTLSPTPLLTTHTLTNPPPHHPHSHPSPSSPPTLSPTPLLTSHTYARHIQELCTSDTGCEISLGSWTGIIQTKVRDATRSRKQVSHRIAGCH